MQLRAALRAMLEPEERVVGWGVAQHEPAAARAAMSLSLMFLPGIGQLLGTIDTMNTLRKQRFAILTDRRLILLYADTRATFTDGSGVAGEHAIETIEVEDRDDAARWWIADDEDPDRPLHGERDARKRAGVARLKLKAPGVEPWTMRISANGRDAATRLVEGLRLLSGEGDGSPTDPDRADGDMLGSGAAEDREHPAP